MKKVTPIYELRTNPGCLDPKEERRRERRAARAAADRFVRACQGGDVAALYAVFGALGDIVNGLDFAMRAVVKQIQAVSPEIQHAFLQAWIDSKNPSLSVGDHRALCAAARVLLPCYRGPSVRLFRGADANERRRRVYGLSWTADRDVAERFARARQGHNGGSVVLETLAPPAAIICAVNYEITRLKSEHSNGEIAERSHEREYVVDRRHLNAVAVVHRMPWLA
jgi:hypothetical protein